MARRSASSSTFPAAFRSTAAADAAKGHNTNRRRRPQDTDPAVKGLWGGQPPSWHVAFLATAPVAQTRSGHGRLLLRCAAKEMIDPVLSAHMSSLWSGARPAAAAVGGGRGQGVLDGLAACQRVGGGGLRARAQRRCPLRRVGLNGFSSRWRGGQVGVGAGRHGRGGGHPRDARRPERALL